jgi:hypothetical protein
MLLLSTKVDCNTITLEKGQIRHCRTIILPVAGYGYEYKTLTLTQQYGNCFRVLENKKSGVSHTHTTFLTPKNEQIL